MVYRASYGPPLSAPPALVSARITTSEGGVACPVITAAVGGPRPCDPRAPDLLARIWEACAIRRIRVGRPRYGRTEAVLCPLSGTYTRAPQDDTPEAGLAHPVAITATRRLACRRTCVIEGAAYPTS